MNSILVESNPSPMKLEVLGVEDWPVIIDQAGAIARSYQSTRICYILQGKASIVADGEDPVNIGEGDLLTIMPDTNCKWTITKEIHRHCDLTENAATNG